jgi:uncharacterized protein YkwD
MRNGVVDMLYGITTLHYMHMSLTFTKRFSSSFALAAIAAVVLTACGGGGGGSDAGSGGSNPGNGSGGTPTTPADIVPAAGSLVTSGGTPTYTNGSVQARAFTALNAARLAAGAGAVQQSTVLEVATAAHAAYLGANLLISHDEDATKNSFYAVTPKDRATKAGYAGSITEVIGGTGASLDGADCTNGLLNTVYHGEAMLIGGWKDVGIGTFNDGIGVPACVMNLGRADSIGQVVPAGEMVAYPSAGVTVDGTFYVGSEVPRPSATLFPNQTAGSVVVTSIRNADFINRANAGTLDAKVTVFNLKDSGGNLIDAHILAGGQVAGSGLTLNADALLGAGTVILVPKAPLVTGAYTVTFAATLGGTAKALNKTWVFNVK